MQLTYQVNTGGQDSILTRASVSQAPICPYAANACLAWLRDRSRDGFLFTNDISLKELTSTTHPPTVNETNAGIHLLSVMPSTDRETKEIRGSSAKLIDRPLQQVVKPREIVDINLHRRTGLNARF